MSRPTYFDKYATIAFERDAQGILVMRLHSDNGPVVYTPQHHADWTGAFYDVGVDRDNAVVIITGTGDTFIDDIAWDKDAARPLQWEDVHAEGKRLMRNLLDIEVPVIGAVNGPATIHAELACLSDITLAAEEATFQDKPHIPFHTVPGDGVHIVWQELLGTNRGRYFLLTGQVLDARQALDWGVVNEVLPRQRLMPRALELARQLAALPPLTRRYARTALIQRLKRLMDENIGYGLALEGLAAVEMIAARKEMAAK
ncbi:crotonase [Steroidobacter denitrificans]|uniref:Crotonase n=1 Tax=Steroidobacter denitrificans TaxID=465721 RepID=A0A127F6Y0_STEDE|nr:enoyl-CoA hydratase/isomerase family protein [Steroidobacter denitrificans]AMN46212.1 crotonase [Steroidobacter denitrificans]